MQTLKQPHQREKWEGGWGIDSIKAFNPAVFSRPHPGPIRPFKCVGGRLGLQKVTSAAFKLLKIQMRGFILHFPRCTNKRKWLRSNEERVQEAQEKTG